MSFLHKDHPKVLCIIPILVNMLPKWIYNSWRLSVVSMKVSIQKEAGDFWLLDYIALCQRKNIFKIQKEGSVLKVSPNQNQFYSSWQIQADYKNSWAGCMWACNPNTQTQKHEFKVFPSYTAAWSWAPSQNKTKKCINIYACVWIYISIHVMWCLY